MDSLLGNYSSFRLAEFLFVCRPNLAIALPDPVV